MGAGLAGLAAAHTLVEGGRAVTLVEGGEAVGGLARTIEWDGFRFDLGGHRFLSEDPSLAAWVRDLLGADCLSVARSSKILLKGRYFDYPLKPLNALFGFGAATSARILLDYARQRLRRPERPSVSLEDWVVRQFGRSLFEIYFRDYSEKVWGIGCRQIDMKWVEQRIQGLSLGQAIGRALLPRRGRALPTLGARFLYPRLGIGQIAERLAGAVRLHHPIHTGARVVRVNHSPGRIDSIELAQGKARRLLKGAQFVSTIPLPALVSALHPRPPAPVLAAASRLGSRDLVTVAVKVARPQVTAHTWIYAPEKAIPFGRIHEPPNWSRDMAPPGRSLLVAEYFCFRGDPVWDSGDEALARRTVSSLAALGLIEPREVLGCRVQRVADAYPLFEVGYSELCRTIEDYLAGFANLRIAGRGGMFRYYNMDHAMLAGRDAARGILAQPAGEAAPQAAGMRA